MCLFTIGLFSHQPTRLSVIINWLCETRDGKRHFLIILKHGGRGSCNHYGCPLPEHFVLKVVGICQSNCDKSIICLMCKIFHF